MKKTSAEWYKEERDKYIIIDSDGWDRIRNLINRTNRWKKR